MTGAFNCTPPCPKVGGDGRGRLLMRDSYLPLAGLQKLSGWNCSITLTGTDGTCSAIHSSTGKVQHSTWLGITRWRMEKSSPHSAISAIS